MTDDQIRGAQPTDTLDDLYPGSGAVTDAWNAWLAQPSLPFPVKDATEPMFTEGATP